MSPKAAAPTRLFSPSYRRDDLGFLDSERSRPLLSARELLDCPAVVIKAQPWMGKTTFARQMQRWLGGEEDGTPCFGRFLGMSTFEESASGISMLPNWWDQWKGSPPETPACWIVDALDECEHSHPSFWERIVREIEEVPPETHRLRLRLLVFTRERSWLPEFEERLGRCYDSQGAGMLSVRMTPLDRREATEMVGSEASFERVADLIRRNDLSAIAGYPRVLAYLRDWRGGPLSIVEVWEAILKDLLREHTHARKQPTTELEDRFEAVTRIAVVLTLADRAELSGGSSTGHGPTVEEIFPLTGVGRGVDVLRRAARESSRLGPFCSTPDGGYRFVQRNVRDWLCAFGLKGLGLGRLRPAVAGEGGPLPHLVDMLHLLKRVSPDQEVRAWLEATLSPLGPGPADAPWGLEEALCQIDRLEEIAARSPRDLSFAVDEGLGRLEAPGLGKHLASRLSAEGRPATVRRLNLDIALAIGASEVVPSAVDIVLDERQDVDLREWAAIVVRRLGNLDDARRLEGLVDRTMGPDRGERSLRAQVILILLETGLWSAHRAARRSPPESRAIGDSTYMLLYEIRQRITAEDARLLIGDFRNTWARQRIDPGDAKASRSGKWPELIPACVKKLLSEPDLTYADHRLLAGLAFQLWRTDWEDEPTIDVIDRLRGNAAGRRLLYCRLISRVARGRPGEPIHWRMLLTPADLSWLLRNAQSHWEGIRSVWEDLYRLAIGSPAGDLRDRAIASVVNHAPDLPEEFEQGRRMNEDQQRLAEERRRRRREGETERVSIALVVDRTLGRSDWSPVDRMRQLSLLCLSREVWRYSNVDGEWTDLDGGRQAEVLRACRDGLEEGTPTPLPGLREFNTLNYAEARAFAVLAADPTNLSWLDASRIGRWLPIVIRTCLSNSLESVRACAGADHAATASVLIAAVEEDLRAGEQHAMTAGLIPAELWPGEIARRLAALVEDGSLDFGARVGLLETLAHREPPAALSIVTHLTERGVVRREVAETLWRRTLDIRLALDPAGTLPHIEDEFRRGGREALRGLPSLGYRSGQLRADLATWSTAMLGRLGMIFLRAYPLSEPSGEESGRAYRVTADHELRWTRDRIVDVLLDRQDNEDNGTLASLVEIEPILGDRSAWVLRQWEASQLLGDLSEAQRKAAPGVGDIAIPTDRVIRLLDEAAYRLVRTPGDLLAALVDVFDRIKGDVAYDLPMLYGKPEPAEEAVQTKGQGGKKGSSKFKKAKARKRLDEDALQAYVRRRLDDLLPACIPGVEIEIIREPQVKYQRRFDLQVTAPTLERGLATVVIEIKWSDNKETGSSLVEQLARKYLRDHGKSHGIYLIGWTGESKPARGTSKDRDELMRLLRDQVASLNENPADRAVVIEPIVLDLRWRDSPPPAEAVADGS